MAAQTGFWVDHTYNGALGAKLTLDVQDGSLLITGLTVLVTLAGAATWTIAAFALHQIRASEQQTDALHAQEQLLLRNSSTALSDTWTLLKIALAWHKHVRRGFWRPFRLLLLPLSIWIAFIVAGLFVSRVTIPSYQANKVLLESGVCGFPSYQGGSLNALLARANKISNDTNAARAYAQQCYHGSPDTLNCDSLPVQALNYTTSMTTCPWVGDRCVQGPSGAYQMDSGWIDSHMDLGINAEESDRVQVRLVNTCSVIYYGDLISKVPDNTTDGESEFYQFNLGAVPDVSNFTFQYSTHSVNDEIPYTLTAEYSHTGVDDGIDVIPALNQTNADLTFVFFAPNSVLYTSPTNDPFFRANGSNMGPNNLIAPDSFVHIMACLDQRQFRNPVTNDTTVLQGIERTGWQSLNLNDRQNATTERIILALFVSDTFNNVNGQNGAALQATNKLFQLFSPGLPENQWQLELQGWFETGLAKFQQYIVDFVDNPWTQDAATDQYVTVVEPSEWQESDSNALQQQCSSQLIRSVAAYQTFSVIGIAIIIFFSVVLVILSLTLSACVRRRGGYKTDADIAHGKINVLRTALEGQGYTGWVKTTQDVPIRPKAGADIQPPTIINGRLEVPQATQLGQNMDQRQEDEAISYYTVSITK